MPAGDPRPSTSGPMAAVPPVARVPPYASLAAVYDRLIGDAGTEPVWRAFRRSCVRYGLRFESAADLGCGTGRFLARLARDPHLKLYGVDRSPAMLERARRRLGDRNVVLLCQDMTRLSLPTRVDLLTINFNSLNYILDPASLRALVDSLASNLRYDGHLVFDIITVREDRGAAPSLRQLIRLPGVRAMWTIAPSVAHEGTVVHTNTCLRRADGWACARERHVQRWWPAATLRQLLERARFRLLGIHRMSDHFRPTQHDQWVQFVAQRRKRG